MEKRPPPVAGAAFWYVSFATLLDTIRFSSS